MANAPEPSNDTETELDAAYQPIQGVGAWGSCAAPEEELTRQLSALGQAQARVPAEVYERVIRRLGREAAAETGAVEALYDLEPGQTRTIALEEPGWEAVLTSQQPGALAIFESQVEVYEYVRQLAADDRSITEGHVHGSGVEDDHRGDPG